ncbi:hypothetical protein GCM10017687_75180 [Streptomyces echinatus]
MPLYRAAGSRAAGAARVGAAAPCSAGKRPHPPRGSGHHPVQDLPARPGGRLAQPRRRPAPTTHFTPYSRRIPRRTSSDASAAKYRVTAASRRPASFRNTSGYPGATV